MIPTESQRRARILVNTVSNDTAYTHCSAQSRSSIEGQSSLENIPAYASTLAEVTLERGLDPGLRRTPPLSDGEDVAVQRELEGSQKTWSAYETLPRDVTQFRDSSESKFDPIDRSDSEESDIDTLDNDAYCTTAELATLSRRHMENTGSDSNHLHLPSSPVNRMSTISTCSSGSGYVINSLHTPLGPPGRDRMSRYSTYSEGYVISHLEWTTKPTLPCIIEDNSGSTEYLQIIPQ